MIKKTLLKIGLCCLGGLLGLNLSYGQSAFRNASVDPETIAKEARDQKNTWIGMFPVHELPDYGFSDYEELLRSETGPAIEIYTLSVDAKGVTSLNATGEFFIPLMLNNEARVFLKMASIKDQYQVVAIGEMTLARDASAFIRDHQNLAEQRMIWIQHLNLSADFISSCSKSDTDNSLNVQPVFTARRAGFSNPLSYESMYRQITSIPVSLD